MHIIYSTIKGFLIRRFFSCGSALIDRYGNGEGSGYNIGFGFRYVNDYGDGVNCGTGFGNGFGCGFGDAIGNGEETNMKLFFEEDVVSNE